MIGIQSEQVDVDVQAVVRSDIPMVFEDWNRLQPFLNHGVRGRAFFCCGFSLSTLPSLHFPFHCWSVYLPVLCYLYCVWMLVWHSSYNSFWYRIMTMIIVVALIRIWVHRAAAAAAVVSFSFVSIPEMFLSLTISRMILFRENNAPWSIRCK